MVNGATFRPADDEEGDGGEGGLLELGAGYFKPLSSRFVFEAYGLVAGGTVKNHFPSTLAANPATTGMIESNLARVGIQSNIALTFDYLDVALSARATRLTFSDVSGSLIFAGEDQVAYLNQESDRTLSMHSVHY